MNIHKRRLVVKLIIAIALIVFAAISAIITSDIKTNIRNNKTKVNTEQEYINLMSGKINEVNNNFQQHILPKPVVEAKQIGFISKVYEQDGKRYLKFDDVSFLMGKEAVEAARKDGNAIYENGEYFVLDDYYIVNKDKQYKAYIIDDNAALNVLDFYINPNSSNIDNKSVTYASFKKAVSQNNDMLCYIYTENDVIVRIEGQYTP